jgi:hypothetical protein
MALPVIESTNTATSLAASSVVVTKPTGLSVGDLMVGGIIGGDIGGAQPTLTTPAGWTVVQKGDTSGGTYNIVTAVYWKIADSGDAAASNFTFAVSTGITSLHGSLSRVTGHIVATPISVSELQQVAISGDTSLTFTTTLTPASPNSLAGILIGASGNNFTANATPSTSSYASTPSDTWVEAGDAGLANASGDGNSLGMAFAEYVGLTEITAMSATISESANGDKSLIGFFINGSYDQTGTNALLEVSPTQFSQAGVAGTNGTNALLEVSPTMFSQSGSATTPTVWTNETKPSTTWTNESK